MYNLSVVHCQGVTGIWHAAAVRLENIVWDARDPSRLGRFWAAALDAEPMTDDPEGFEARMTLSGDAFLDLCFQRVAEPSSAPARLHLDLAGGARQRDVVERLLGLGATHADIGQGEVPWVVLADPEGNAFCVMEDREAYRGTGPIAALPLDSADPDRDAAFWAEITGWIPWDGIGGAVTLRHPSGSGRCSNSARSRSRNGGRTGCTWTSAPVPGTVICPRASWTMGRDS
jgi:Glyoxalase-like domain